MMRMRHSAVCLLSGNAERMIIDRQATGRRAVYHASTPIPLCPATIRTMPRSNPQNNEGITESSPVEGRKPPSRRGESLKGYWWRKGQSGNPGGRPKTTGITMQQLREVALENSIDMLHILIGIARASKSPGTAAFAAEAVLNRAVGKPLQATAIVTGESAKESWDELILRLAREAGPSAPAAEVLAGEVLELERVDSDEEGQAEQ